MNAFHATLMREWRRMTSRRLYFGVCLILPLFALFFMATIFGNGSMRELPVGIVDKDNSAASREIIRRMESVPTFHVTEIYSDEVTARRDVQQKHIYGYLVIPHRFAQEATSLTYYYHYALLSVGGELMAAFEKSLAGVSVAPLVMQAEAVGVTPEEIETFLLPIEENSHPLHNPDLNYSIYLSQPIFFVLLQIIILLVTVYTFGSELKFRTTQEWLATAHGNLGIAVVGKLFPYSCIFSAIAIAANYTFFGTLHIPLAGSIGLLNLTTILFILATQALALILFSLFPRIAIIISIVSMIGSLGATLSGITFPVSAMYKPVYLFSYLFPVRHFTESIQAIGYFNAGIATIWPNWVVLMLFPLLAIALIPLLDWWMNKEKRRSDIPSEQPHQSFQEKIHSPTWHHIIYKEWRRIVENPAVLLVLSGGVLFYGVLYNYMYAPNVVRKVPIAVVDLSHSSLSRQYIRWLNATPQTDVRYRTPNLPEARKLLKEGKVDGILYLPSDFETRVNRGEQAVYTLYANTDAFLTFKSLQEATTHVMLALNETYREKGIIFLPPEGWIAIAAASPIPIRGRVLYNITGGYGSYLIPAVLVIIIFQTMLMAIAIVRGEEAERQRRRAIAEKNMIVTKKKKGVSVSNWIMAFRLLVGRSSVYVGLYLIFSLFLFGLLPALFPIPHLGNAWNLLILLTPFLLATAFFGMTMSRWFTDAEAPLLMITFFSVGYIFLSGISYPLELMPWYWQVAHALFPATPATLAFVQIHSMGASLSDIWPQLITLWIQVMVYGVLGVFAIQRNLKGG
ncbi:MAG: ABC transporter permease [Bacteroides sp.]|nr:ABC transporter permease [Bacteroides sp.]